MMRVFLAAIMIAACGHAAYAQQNADEQAVHALWQRFEAAYNAGDAGAVGRLFTPDADRVSGPGPVIRGRAAIEQDYARMLARRASDPSTQPFRPQINVRLIRPGVALIDGEWEGVRAGRAVGGRFTLIAVQLDQQWLFDAGRAWEFPNSP